MSHNDRVVLAIVFRTILIFLYSAAKPEVQAKMEESYNTAKELLKYWRTK